ncbi:hypothetical protein CLOM_g17702 [Closterium sp. NIES-68]|nr:hypothetical protein CLOM_g17702 [Closterium sp. NIES-68]
MQLSGTNSTVGAVDQCSFGGKRWIKSGSPRFHLFKRSTLIASSLEQGCLPPILYRLYSTAHWYPSVWWLQR